MTGIKAIYQNINESEYTLTVCFASFPNEVCNELTTSEGVTKTSFSSAVYVFALDPPTRFNKRLSSNAETHMKR